jgi:hypothetical protein
MNTYEKTPGGEEAQVSSSLDHFPFTKIVIPSKARDLLFRCQAPALFPLLTTHYSLLTVPKFTAQPCSGKDSDWRRP